MINPQVIDAFAYPTAVILGLAIAGFWLYKIFDSKYRNGHLVKRSSVQQRIEDRNFNNEINRSLVEGVEEVREKVLKK